jgi:hypothetical protein
MSVASLYPLPRDAKVIDFEPRSSRAWFALADACTVVLIDTKTGDEVGRRTFEGWRWPRRFGPQLVLERSEGGCAVAPDDLSAAAEVLIEAGRLLGVAAGVAHITVEDKEDLGDAVRYRFEHVAIGLASRSVLRRAEAGEGTWRFPDPDQDLALCVLGAHIDAFRSSTGEALWSVDPFEGTPINSIDGTVLLGERLHVRAATIDDQGWTARVVTLDLKTGKPNGPPRPSSSGVPAWIGDHGDAVEALSLELDGFQRDLPDGIALEQDDQLLILRDTAAGPHVQRVAIPTMADATIAHGYLYGAAEVGGRTELVVMKLPGRDEGEVVATRLEPRGPLVVSGGELATVTFVGSSVPYVVAVHEKHGRINLPRGDEHAGVKKGDLVLLVDLVVKSGGVVSVGAWHLGAEPPARRAVVLEPGPARRRERPARKPRPRLVEPLVARATEAGVSLPNAMLALVRRVEESESLRCALQDCGLFFEEDQLALDTIEELAEVDEEDEGPALSSFVPVWGNGYSDSIGGILHGRNGVVILHLPERDVVEAGPDIVAVVRGKLADSDAGAATRALVERTLSTIEGDIGA